MKNNRPMGFTLVELLVVVGVIGVLAGLLLPALTGARATAKRAHCVSNLRQIGLAIALYQDQYDGEFPGTTHGASLSNSWVFTLQPYIANVDRIRICPSDPRGKQREQLKLTSYVLNEYISVPLVDPFGNVIESFTNIRRLKNPSQTVTVFEGADNLGLSVTQDHTHSRNWANPNVWTKVRGDIQPDRHRTQAAAPQRDRGTANYLFADGHVETLDAAKLRKQFEAGVNLAQPPN